MIKIGDKFRCINSCKLRQTGRLMFIENKLYDVYDVGTEQIIFKSELGYAGVRYNHLVNNFISIEELIELRNRKIEEILNN